NANPLSMRAGFMSLAARQPGAGGRRIVALTDMLELGAESDRLHADLAQPIETARIDLVFAAGPAMRALYDALPESRRGGWAATAAELAPAAAAAIRPGDVVMVKGSNGSRATLIAKALGDLGAQRESA